MANYVREFADPDPGGAVGGPSPRRQACWPSPTISWVWPHPRHRGEDGIGRRREKAARTLRSAPFSCRADTAAAPVQPRAGSTWLRGASWRETRRMLSAIWAAAEAGMATSDARCGVIRTFSIRHSGSSAGSGSRSNTSSVAAPRWPLQQFGHRGLVHQRAARHVHQRRAARQAAAAAGGRAGRAFVR